MSSQSTDNNKLVTRNSGPITIKELSNSDISDNQSMGYEFIRKLFMEFAKESYRYGHNKYGFIMYPHHYSEKQLSSVLTPILHKLCNGFVMAELPVIRKDSDNIGWVDYWCIYKNYTIVIEVKHSKDILDTATIRQNSIVRRWGKMKKQLEDIYNEIKSFEEKTEGVIRIGLHFISSYSNKEYEESSALSYRNNIKETLTKFNKRLKSDYTGCWLIPEDSSCRWDGLAFPGVLLMGRILAPVKHK